MFERLFSEYYGYMIQKRKVHDEDELKRTACTKNQTTILE
jgi:hypothetical protein